MIDAFDNLVADMMYSYGTKAHVVVVVSEEYDPDTSENVVVTRKIPVNAIFFDYIDKSAGVGAEKNKLIQTGDKQVYIQPPQKAGDIYPLPTLNPTADYFEHGGKRYKIVTMKQHNTTMSREGCVLYELYIRE